MQKQNQNKNAHALSLFLPYRRSPGPGNGDNGGNCREPPNKNNNTLNCPDCGGPCTRVVTPGYVKCVKCSHLFIITSEIDRRDLPKEQFNNNGNDRRHPPTPKKIMEYLGRYLGQHTI